MLYEQFAKLLSKLLKDVDRSASWLAKRLGVSPTTVNRWVNGENRPNSPEEIVRISDVLGLKQSERQALLLAVGFGYQDDDKSTNGIKGQGDSTSEVYNQSFSGGTKYSCVYIGLQFQKSVEGDITQQFRSLGPERGLCRVERVLQYLERLAEERSGEKDVNLTKTECEALVAVTWMREFRFAGITPTIIDDHPLRPVIEKLSSLQPETLKQLTPITAAHGQQFRLQLLGALLLLAEDLDLDHRSVQGIIPLGAHEPVERQITCWLRQYVSGVLIRSGEISLDFAIPRSSYESYLQAWLVGPLLRTFNLVVRVFIAEKWHLWLIPSTYQNDSKPPIIPEFLLQALADPHRLLSVLRPMLATLDDSPKTALRPRLIPAPLTALLQPPLVLSWDLPPIQSDERYEVELIEKESNKRFTFDDLSQPYLDNLQTISWTPGGRYQWAVYNRKGQKRRSLASGIFSLLSSEECRRLLNIAAELPTQTKASRRTLWRAMGLYEDVIHDLLKTIQQAITAVERFSAYQELADLYDQLTQEARHQQRATLADEYGSLTVAQYQYLRELVIAQKDN